MSDREPTEEAQRPADPRAVEAARAFLVATLKHMGTSLDVRVYEDRGDTVLEIHGPGAEGVVGKRGMILDALQILAHRVAAKEMKGERSHLVLDAAGYRSRREKALTDMAEQAGTRCLEQRRTVTLEPMPPRERRVVHMALARFPGVTTRSEGDGDERRVQIIPMPPPR